MAVVDALIVPRGLSNDYYFFMEVFAKTNAVELIIDRRRPDELRRQRLPVSTERRVADRRRPLPGTWQESGFIRVER